METGVEPTAIPTSPSLEVATASTQLVVSARKRFMFTVATNLTRSGISFGTSMLIARALGPAEYGNMAFLIGTFSGVRAMLDMGSSSAFFTFLSQRSRSWRFVRSFFLWMAAQFVVPVLVIGTLMPTRWVTTVWHSQPRPLVLLAFVAAFLQLSFWPAVQQACESQRRTFLAQGLGVGVVIVHLAAMTVLWKVGILGLYVIFGAIAIECFTAAVVALTRLRFSNDASPDEVHLFSKYYRYCLPLIPLAAVSFSSEFADRWLLQSYGGGVQQAFYAVR